MNKTRAIKIFLCIFWLAAVILPLIQMLSTAAGVNIIDIITARKFFRALTQSLTVSTTAAGISIILAGILAWSIARTNIKHKTILNTIIIIPMLIPSISHGMGLITILGANGWLSRLVGLRGGIYGFWGIVIGSVMYSFPVAYLMLYDILRYEDGTPYEAAEVMGMSAGDKFFAITLPYLRKPLISVIFAVFTMIITDYGVPLMVGGKYITLPVMMYQDVIGMLEFGKGSVIGMILLIPALIACVLDIMNRDKGNSEFISKSYRIKQNNLRDNAAKFIICVILLMILTPIASFSVLGFINKYPIDMRFSLENIKQAINMGAIKYLMNSIIIASLTAIIGTALALVNSYMTARNRTRSNYILHLVSITSLAIPGIVLGLSYIMFFKASIIYGTFVILILVNITHFFASPYLMAYNTFGKINENLESVGATLGIKKFDVIKDVILPQSIGTILEMAGYFFVNSMMTISAVSFLANANNKPAALMITQFEGQMQLECAAFVSLAILLVNIFMKFISAIIKRTRIQ